MRALILALVLSALVSLGPAHAADSEARSLADQLMVLTDVEENLAQLRGQVEQMMTAQMRTMDVPENMKEKLVAHQHKIVDLVFDAMSWESMKDEYLDIYASVFSREELQGLVDFYRSPVGRSFAEKLPLLNSRMMELAQARTQALGPAVQKLTTSFLEDLRREPEGETEGGGQKPH